MKTHSEDYFCFAESRHIYGKTVFKFLCGWVENAGKYKKGEISKEEYDRWRYNYPTYDIT